MTPRSGTIGINTDLATVLDTIADMVADRVAARIGAAPTPSPGQRLATKSELARELSCSTATVDRMVREGMPFVAVGRTRRFDLADCRAWCEARTERAPQRTAPQGAVRLLSRGAQSR